MDINSSEEPENRLFLLTVIGKELSDILLDLEKLHKTFFKEFTSNKNFTEVMKKLDEAIPITDKIIEAVKL